MYGFLNSERSALVQLEPIALASNLFAIILDSASILFISILSFCSGDSVIPLVPCDCGEGVGV